MPELPEVETVVRSLRPQLLRQTVRSVWCSEFGLRLARRIDTACLRSMCVGRAVEAVRRKGKYILIDLRAKGADAGTGVLVHLGMTGQLRVSDADEKRVKHTHVVWALSGGRELRFVDPRRFGWVEAAEDINSLPEVRGLGPDALEELDVATLRSLLSHSRAPIKGFLLDQRRLAGLGNIYVSEALFRARIHPATPARNASVAAPALLRAIRTTLAKAVGNRGTTIRDFVDSNGEQGDHSKELLVYGREGQGCRRCRTLLRRTVDSGRSTYFCPSCQRLL